MIRLGYIASELKEHAPFTALGAGVGVVVMVILTLAELPSRVSDVAFHTLHPAHLLLSSAVTATMFKRHGGGIPTSIAIGIAGSIAICTMSDVALPHAGGAWIGASMDFHPCILEEPLLAFLSAFVGAAIGALFLHLTRCPHGVHVLISTMASLFYLMASGEVGWLPLLPFVFGLLFVSVWIPCCTSDIVFPLLFLRERE